MKEERRNPKAGQLKKKFEGWNPYVHRYVWHILRLLKRKEPETIRGLRKSGFTGSFTTLEKYVGMLEKKGLVTTEKTNSFPIKRLIKLTNKRRKALKAVDKLGGR